jgi:hypothetical protein
MPTTTPNLGLFKRDPLTEGNHYFNIKEQINDPLDVIDEKVGGELVSRAPETVTLKNGLQIVEASRVSRLRNIRIRGRTLVNLLGRVGNCESTAGFNVANATLELNTSNFAIGTKSIKFTSTINGAASVNLQSALGVIPFPDPTKYYLVASSLKNGTVTNGVFVVAQGVGTGSTKYGNIVTSTSGFETSYVTVAPSDLTGATQFIIYAAYTDGHTQIGQYAYVDAIRMYEITEAEKLFIDGLTTSEAQAYIDAKYPYVDDIKHVNAVYVRNPGKNLLPPFTEWNLHANAVVTSPYELTLNASAGYQNSYVDVSVTGGQTYTLKITGTASTGYIASHIAWYAENSDQYISLTPTLMYSDTPLVVTAPQNAVKARVYIRGTVEGLFTFKNIMFNVGSKALPFEPHQPSYLYLPDVKLRANADGSVADQFYMDGEGNPRAVRRFREMVLDGSLAWQFHANAAGYKIVKFPLTDGADRSGVGIKYNGTILPDKAALDGANQLTVWNNFIYLSIAASDSGWGDSYIPTVDEIKAYFWGWKMYNRTNGSPSSIYDNTANAKGWAKLDNAGIYQNQFVSTVPATQNEFRSNYRLVYQLKKTVDEAVDFEGAIQLHEGLNQIEVGTGIVVRETVNPIFSGGYWYINTVGIPASWLKYRAREFISIFRNTDSYRKWEILYDGGMSSGTGPVRARLSDAEFDVTSTYATTYLALDAHALGIVPLSISGEYTPNIKESIDDLAKGFKEMKTQLSVLQNTKAQKQPPGWITPTLLNGASGGNVAYRKRDDGTVEFKGIIQTGVKTVGTVLFKLPPGYFPANGEQVVLNAQTYTGGTKDICQLDVLNGEVRIRLFSAQDYIVLYGLSFSV